MFPWTEKRSARYPSQCTCAGGPRSPQSAYRTLPANPRPADRVNLVDVAGQCGTTKVIVARNGNKIANLAEDLDFDIKNASLELIYTGSTYGWKLTTNL